MALEDIVNLAISASSKTPTRAGFGVPLLFVQKVPAGWGPNRVRLFGSLTEMTDLGFSTSDPAYKMAEKLKSQDPSIKKWKVGRRLNLSTQIIKLTVSVITEGYVYKFKVAGTEITYTVLAAATTTSVAAALAALIDPLAGITATSAVAVITITGTAGEIFDVEGFYDHGLAFEDASVAIDVTADINACATFDKDWYGLLADRVGKTESLALSAWTESNKKLYAGRSCDSAVADSGSTTDLFYVTKVGTYYRTHLTFSSWSLLNYEDCGIIGSRFPADPGSDTWKFKTLANVFGNRMTEGEKAAVWNKNGNTYTEVAGVNITENGKTSGGEWADVVRFLDWLASEIKVRVFSLFINSAKVPYTDAGADLIAGVVKNTLQDGINVGGIDGSKEPTVTYPLVEDVDTTIRATRVYPEFEFDGRLAGAIHAVNINGSLTV